MAERADERSPGSLRELLGEAGFAAVGAVLLTKERAEELADAIAERGSMTRAEARAFLEDTAGRWRGEAVRTAERAGSSLTVLLKELGLVTRHEYEELELRLAQVEHRLRLVERPPAVPPGPGP